MTIGLFSDTFPPDINGVATATKNLFDVLSSMGHTVYVITTNLEGKKEIRTARRLFCADAGAVRTAGI